METITGGQIGKLAEWPSANPLVRWAMKKAEDERKKPSDAVLLAIILKDLCSPYGPRCIIEMEILNSAYDDYERDFRRFAPDIMAVERGGYKWAIYGVLSGQ